MGLWDLIGTSQKVVIQVTSKTVHSLFTQQCNRYVITPDAHYAEQVKLEPCFICISRLSLDNPFTWTWKRLNMPPPIHA